MTQHITEATVPQKLADELSRIIRDSLTPGQMARLRRKKTYVAVGRVRRNPSGASLAMTQAFALVMGRQSRSDFDADIALMKAAWALAQNARFPRKLELTQNGEGLPVYAYVIKEVYVHNPHLSVCTRFQVDPSECYGLRPEEVAALEHANAPRCRPDLRAAQPISTPFQVPHRGSLLRLATGLRG